MARKVTWPPFALAGGGSLIAIHSSPSQSHVNATIITIKEGKDIKILFAGKYFVYAPSFLTSKPPPPPNWWARLPELCLLGNKQQTSLWSKMAMGQNP